MYKNVRSRDVYKYFLLCIVVNLNKTDVFLCDIYIQKHTVHQ